MRPPGARSKILVVFVLVKLSHLHRADLERQSEQGDEAVGVVVVIEISGGEGGQRLAV